MGKLFGDNLLADQSRLINKDRGFFDSGFTCGSDAVMPRNNFNLAIDQDRGPTPSSRGCGGCSSVVYWHPSPLGLSPRGRGNHILSYMRVPWLGSIPAWAGEPAPRIERPFWTRVYPRVGGGTTVSGFTSYDQDGLSPRGRGNQGAPTRPAISRRSIPAWAGEPRALCLVFWGPGVYPRVGGGTKLMKPPPADTMGLSPRGRGNLHAG